jgi:hypothetical protein
MPHLRRPLALCAVALGLGLCADLLFYNRAPGLSAPLFVGLLLAASAWVARIEGVRLAPANRWLGGAALLFAALVAVRAAPLLVALNLLAALGLLLLYAALARAEHLLRLDGWRVALGAAGAALAAALLPAPLAATQAGRLLASSGRARPLLVVGRGALLAAPVLVVFTGLLAMADGIFASYVADALQLRLPFDLGALAGHLVLVGGVAWCAAGGLLAALREHRPGALLGPPRDVPAEGDTQRLSPPLSVRRLGWGEAVTVLALVDTLFVAFMLIQGAYLFGGRSTLERTGMTFAEYARRGFFELVTVACLALACLWALALVSWRERPLQLRAFNGLCAAMVALVLGMLASAALRMWLYEQAYGFTLLRVLTHSFMAWLAVVLALFLAALLLARPRLFSLGAPASALVYLLALNLLNPDALIVRENIARYQATGKLDAAYLATLSADAVPPLVGALPAAGEQRVQLEAQLQELRARLDAAAARDGLPGWNAGRARAAALLAALPADQGQAGAPRSP